MKNILLSTAAALAMVVALPAVASADDGLFVAGIGAISGGIGTFSGSGNTHTGNAGSASLDLNQGLAATTSATAWKSADATGFDTKASFVSGASVSAWSSGNNASTNSSFNFDAVGAGLSLGLEAGGVAW